MDVLKSIYRMEKSLFIDFDLIFENKKKKPAILDCAAILKDFQKRCSTKC
jgi:hypothetical protein